MEILRKNVDLNIILNKETDFQTNAGWQENLVAFEDEILSTILNPIENYETIRYIHKPYTLNNINQTDIWFYFYFATSGNTPNYVQDYSVQGITLLENEKMMKQSSESFFRLEFFKTPGILDGSGNTIGYQPPTRQNRKLVFAKNLSLPLGEKYYYTPLGGYIHLPVFKGSNYENKENMYFFWFQDESVLKETNLSGTTTGNTFFMTAKFFNAKDGSIQDFTNDCFSTGYTLNEQNDMYYQVDIDKTDYSYKVYYFNGVVKCDQVGFTNKPISFFEKGGGSCPNGLTYYTCSNVTPTPTLTSTPAATPVSTPVPTSTPTLTPTLTPTPSTTSNNTSLFSGSGYFGSTVQAACGDPLTRISGNFTGNATSFCSSTYFTGNTFDYQSSGTYYLQYGENYQQISITFGSNIAEVTGAGCSSCPEPDEWYKIENCFDSSTGYTDSFASNTFNLNDRVVTYLTPSKVWKVIEILTANPGGVKENVSLTTPAAIGCPTLYTYYYATPKTETTEYCTSPGYIINGVFKTTASSISSITPGSTVIYNTDGTPWVGLGDDYRYPISDTSGQNTYTLFNSINYMKVDSNGLVSSKGTFNCSGGGSGGNEN